uniref:Uncharacterized protein n=1 Tax=Vicia faba TaxID=3906 RepID=R4ITZ5_VICFA|nr:hypothetical protein [Vicia faba]
MFIDLETRSIISIYQYIFLDLSPYLRKNQHLKGVTNGRFSPPVPDIVLRRCPLGERGHHYLSFFNRSDQDKWVGFVLLSTQFSVFVRDHVGRKVVSCRGAAVKRRFPPFHLSRGGLLPHHSGLLFIGILPMLKVACLPSHPLDKLVARKKRRGREASLPPVVEVLGATLIQKVTDGSRLYPVSATVIICHSIHKPFFQ